MKEAASFLESVGTPVNVHAAQKRSISDKTRRLATVNIVGPLIFSAALFKVSTEQTTFLRYQFRENRHYRQFIEESVSLATSWLTGGLNSLNFTADSIQS